MLWDRAGVWSEGLRIVQPPPLLQRGCQLCALLRLAGQHTSLHEHLQLVLTPAWYCSYAQKQYRTGECRAVRTWRSSATALASLQL